MVPGCVCKVTNHILRRIGQGRFGEVWLAETVTGKFRAVKVVRRERFAAPALSQAGIDAIFGLEFDGQFKEGHRVMRIQKP